MHFNVRLILVFLLQYALAVLYLRQTCWHDPTSKFYQRDRAHEPKYTIPRTKAAETYADEAPISSPGAAPRSQPPELCVAIPSVKRPGVSYLKTALGSLHEGLTPDERARLHVIVLLAQIDQEDHPDHDAPWLLNMADQVPRYQDYPDQLALTQRAALNKTGNVKHKLDYSFLLSECLKTGAPYDLMAEDDVVFMDGWRHRTMHALEAVTEKTVQAGHERFTYLRLFYYEDLLGWNAESWPKYLFWSLVVTTFVAGTLFIMHRQFPWARKYANRSSALMIVFLFTPLYILLYFSAGANCMQPQPLGVHVLSRNACCAQGLVFSRETIENELLTLYYQERWSEHATDTIIEQHADRTGGLRWALTPVVMQHIGGKSSHGRSRGNLGLRMPGRLWNIGFEDNDVDELAEEHLHEIAEMAARDLMSPTI